MADSGGILMAVNYVNHLQHNLGCLEDLLSHTNLNEVQIQPQLYVVCI